MRRPGETLDEALQRELRWRYRMDATFDVLRKVTGGLLAAVAAGLALSLLLRLMEG